MRRQRWPKNKKRRERRLLLPVTRFSRASFAIYASTFSVVRCGKEEAQTAPKTPPTYPHQTDPVFSGLENWQLAARAAESKKAKNLVILDVREVTSFTEFFIICTSTSQRQGQTIADEVGKQLKSIGELPVSVEGYDAAEWILLDYGDFLVHIFSETARQYYDLERLWRHGKVVELQEGLLEAQKS
jgi:ribosome-associated protein